MAKDLWPYTIRSLWMRPTGAALELRKPHAATTCGRAPRSSGTSSVQRFVARAQHLVIRHELVEQGRYVVESTIASPGVDPVRRLRASGPLQLGVLPQHLLPHRWLLATLGSAQHGSVDLLGEQPPL